MLVAALLVASALVCGGLVTAGARRDPAAAAAGIPALAGGAGLAFVAFARWASSPLTPAAGQEVAVIVSIAGLCGAILAAGLLAPGAGPGPAGTEERAQRRRRERRR